MTPTDILASDACSLYEKKRMNPNAQGYRILKVGKARVAGKVAANDFFPKFHVPSVIVENPKTFNFDAENHALYLVFLSLSSENFNITPPAELLHLDNLSKIIFISKIEMGASTLLNLFEWCWSNEIINVLTVAGEQIYSYDPFPRVALTNLTDERRLSVFFKNKMMDFNGKSIRTPMFNDIPRTFRYFDENGSTKFAGYMYQIISAFAKKHNGSLEVSFTTYDIENFVELLNTGKIDIFPFIYFAHPAFENLSKSYTINSIWACIIVPYSAELPRYTYFKLPFTDSSWYCIVGASLVLLIVSSVALFRVEKKLRIRYTIHHLVRILLQQPNIDENWPKALQLIFILALVLNMLIANLYQSGLSSFFTKSIAGKQIDTFDDLIKSNVRIRIGDGTYRQLANFKLYPLAARKNLIKPDPDFRVELPEVVPDYGYLLTDDQYEFLSEFHKYTSRPIFRRGSMCFSKSQFFIPLRRRSAYRDIMNNLVFQIQESGILMKWESDTFGEAVKGGLIKPIVIDQELLRPLTVSDFKIVWSIFGCALSLCLMSFLCELVTAYVLN
ncbi:uncharacterized protein LOC119647740 [Hermetia illucens]|uniref:uncharacterized protein LOC119647740 n=1 Tax=Hermetia illucens TaxID=343691 RepID=UPI0018CC4E6A|nr:uncharacterized protein LOC119647740 [Hermetia illucens]